MKGSRCAAIARRLVMAFPVVLCGMQVQADYFEDEYGDAYGASRGKVTQQPQQQGAPVSGILSDFLRSRYGDAGGASGGKTWQDPQQLIRQMGTSAPGQQPLQFVDEYRDTYGAQRGRSSQEIRQVPRQLSAQAPGSDFRVPYDPTLPTKRILVANFRNEVPALGSHLNVESGLTTQLQTALSKCRNFHVVDRGMIGDLKNELVLSQSGAMTPESAPQAGKLVGAQVIIRGTVTDFAEQVSGRASGRRFNIGSIASFASAFTDDRRVENLAGTDDMLNVGSGEETVTGTVGLTLQLIDVSTGELLQSVQVSKQVQEARSSSVLGIAGFSTQNEQFGRTAIGQATRQAIEEAVYKIFVAMKRVPWEGMVAAVKPDGTVIINAGIESNIRPGTELVVEAETAHVTDPATGLVIYSEKATVARLLINRALDKVSFAELLQGSDVQRGDKVRIANLVSPARR